MCDPRSLATSPRSGPKRSRTSRFGGECQTPSANFVQPRAELAAFGGTTDRRTDADGHGQTDGRGQTRTGERTGTAHVDLRQVGLRLGSVRREIAASAPGLHVLGGAPAPGARERGSNPIACIDRRAWQASARDAGPVANGGCLRPCPTCIPRSASALGLFNSDPAGDSPDVKLVPVVGLHEGG